MYGSGCRVQGAGCRVQGAGFRVQGAGCRVTVRSEDDILGAREEQGHRVCCHAHLERKKIKCIVKSNKLNT